MKQVFTIHQEVHIEGRIYKVIGVDSYILQNILEQQAEWVSYTLVDHKGEKTWISHRAVKDYFIQWFLISKEEFIKLSQNHLNTDLTGIAHITFEGNPGFSTPIAEIVWFNLINGEYDYVASERFLEQTTNNIKPLEVYYNAGKILKDFNPELG